MYESLTDFIKRIESDSIGEWHGGIKEEPDVSTFPFVAYSAVVHEFADAVRNFVDKHQEFELYRFHAIIEEKCKDFMVEEIHQLDDVKINALDGRTVMALIVWAVRGERFCDGLLLSRFEDGSMMRCLQRLKDIDEFIPDHEVINSAHQYSANNRKSLEKDEVCGCFHCCKTFSPKLIREWIDDGSTAICPFCGIDAIIGDDSDSIITEEFLRAINKEWFS